jgi:NAD(P)-dependent dehydrogenase (short-subunit alcohol dehydrogenase family)
MPAPPDPSSHNSPGDRVAVVTGGLGAIGSAIAQRLESAGFTVAVADLAGPRAGVERVFHLDVTDDASCDRLRGEVVERFGRSASVVVNCAGVMLRGSLSDLDLDAAAKAHAVNVWGAQRVTRTFVEDMKADGFGRVVNISSIQAWLGLEGYSAYASSKAAINSLSRVWARELGPYGITVNAVAPGYVNAPMIDGLFERLAAKQGSTPAAARRRLTENIAIGRLVEPAEVAAVVAFLASAEASAVNGVSLLVDGGNALA